MMNLMLFYSTIEVEPMKETTKWTYNVYKKRNNALFLNELNEIKVEFDLIFVSLVDKISCDSFCSLSSSSVSIPHIENSLYNSPTGFLGMSYLFLIQFIQL
jgi:uridine kinase